MMYQPERGLWLTALAALPKDPHLLSNPAGDSQLSRTPVPGSDDYFYPERTLAYVWHTLT